MTHFMYNLLVRPSLAFEELREGRGRGAGLVFLVAVTSLHVAFSMAGPRATEAFPFVFLWIVLVVLAALGAAVAASIMHLAASALGGEGRVEKMLGALGASFLPLAFCTPAILLARVVAGSPMQPLLVFVSGMIICLWMVALLVTGIRGVYHLGLARALSTVVALAGLTGCLAASVLAFFLISVISAILG